MTAGSMPGPIGAREREPVLDVLRGAALLGILLVNIEFMRGSGAYASLFGVGTSTSRGTSDRVTSFAIGWLVSGKFLSAFALLFGLGAALITGRARAAGRSGVGLLARRNGWLLAFGLAHMLLLFPGDVLFVYGLAGMLLLGFVTTPPGALWRWSFLLVVGTALLLAVVTGLAPVPAESGSGGSLAGMAAAQQDRAAAAYGHGSYAEVVVANAVLSVVLQFNQLVLLPWFLGLLLFGFAVGRRGVVEDLRGHHTWLVRSAVVGLGIGLPLNLVLGFVGPLGAGADSLPPWSAALATAVQYAGAPMLAVGYLATLALACLRWGTPRPLAAVGRMALSGYLLQSALALAVFWGFGLYDELRASQALLVVVGIWVVIVAVSVLWLRRFAFGPAEWLWRSLVYGRRQPFRIRRPDGGRSRASP